MGHCSQAHLERLVIALGRILAAKDRGLAAAGAAIIGRSPGL
jgi:hypothetical protein